MAVSVSINWVSNSYVPLQQEPYELGSRFRLLIFDKKAYTGTPLTIRTNFNLSKGYSEPVWAFSRGACMDGGSIGPEDYRNSWNESTLNFSRESV